MAQEPHPAFAQGPRDPGRPHFVKTVRGGKKAEAKVWEGADGLEWQLPSPPPFHSWTTAPQVR